MTLAGWIWGFVALQMTFSMIGQGIAMYIEKIMLKEGDDE